MASTYADVRQTIGALCSALSTEWRSLGVILALSIANIVLGVWRPRLVRRSETV